MASDDNEATRYFAVVLTVFEADGYAYSTFPNYKYKGASKIKKGRYSANKKRRSF